MSNYANSEPTTGQVLRNAFSMLALTLIVCAALLFGGLAADADSPSRQSTAVKQAHAQFDSDEFVKKHYRDIRIPGRDPW